MALLFKQLNSRLKIEKLIAQSLDLALYHAIVVIDGEEHLVKKDNDNFLKFHNPLDVQRAFAKIPYMKMVIRHSSAYDEMVGQPNKEGDNAMEVTFGRNNLV